MTTHAAIHERKPCRFYDSYGEVLWDGFTDGSRWNGFLNVAVGEDVFKRLWMAWYGENAMRREDEWLDDWETFNPNDIPTIDDPTHGTLRDLSNCYATTGEHDFDD